MKSPLFMLTLSVCAMPVFAGGELSESSSRVVKISQRTAETRARIASLQKGLADMEMAAAMDAQAAIDARKAKVVAIGPVQDKYGDPMYTWYGPLVPEPGTPEYDGPRYGASFDRGYMQPVPHDQYRGYARGAQYYGARVGSHFDTVLGTAASNMYMQSGMQVAPGSMAPSAARAMINNP